MKKKLILSLKVLGILVLLLIAAGFFTYRYFMNNLFWFEEEYAERVDIKKSTEDGYAFFDRNGNGKLDIYEDHRKSIESRVANVISLMTLEEKIHLLKGSGISSASGMNEPGEGIPGAVGTIVPTPRLGIPTVYLSDGPAGLRIKPTREGEERTYYCTAFPIATLLASTWNEELVYQVGDAMGTEASEYGLDIILGPAMNIHRHPFCGRNFEYFSEDPVLSGYIAAGIVNGIESNGIGTSIKHFVANNQETSRDLNDAIISQRALREIYLKGFEIAVREAQPWTIMSSYNKINGEYTSESEFLLTDVLRDDWGFQGLVMTDWYGGRNPQAQISAGNDMLQPGTKRQWESLIEAFENEQLPIEYIDRAASRILTLVFKTRKLEDYEYGNNPDLKAHANITRQSAAEGMILLKNENTLPIVDAKTVALLGVTSYQFISGGTGSGDVNEAYSISLEQGLINAGFEINNTAKKVYEEHRAANAEAFIKPEGIDAMFNPYLPPEMIFTEEQLKTIAEGSDIGILTIGRNSGEGGDRHEEDDFLLTDQERRMITDASRSFHSLGKKLIVILNIGGVIETASWKSEPDGILLAWQGGQEGGNSVADILVGNVNPSGKLPMTFPIGIGDHASHANFPQDGEPHSMAGLMMQLLVGGKEDTPDPEKVRNHDYTQYDEGVYVGYRHFDKKEVDVSYPFGYGLSYSDFEYGEMNVSAENDTVKIVMEIKNNGSVAGKEVVQVYVEKLNSSIDRPIRELKAFAKTEILQPGAIDSLYLEIPINDFRYWNEVENKWTLEQGAYQINAGASSRDIRQTFKIEL